MKKYQMKIFYKISRKRRVCAHYIILKDDTFKQGVGGRYSTVTAMVKQDQSTSMP